MTSSIRDIPGDSYHLSVITALVEVLNAALRKFLVLQLVTQTPGRIQKVDPLRGFL